MPTKGKSTKQIMKTEMHKFKHGNLHSGSKHGKKVKSRKQAIAIGLSEAREAGHHVPPHHEHGSISEGARRTGGERDFMADMERHSSIEKHGHDMTRSGIIEKHGMLPFPDGSRFTDEGQQTPYGTHPAAIPHIPPNHAAKHGPAPAPLPAHRSSGYGHAAHQRHGHMRMSGHKGAHQIGKR
jgi:hypothetical protein